MLLRKSLLLNIRNVTRTPRRCNSTLVDERDFLLRKNHVKENHLLFYPSITSPALRTDDIIPELRLPRFRELFSNYKFPEDSKRLDDQYRVNGRVTNIRKAGKGMMFIDLEQDFTRLQIVASNKLMGLTKELFVDSHALHRIGDSISCTGYPGVTNVGELSIKLSKPLVSLSPSLRLLPPKLTDTAKINANRVVDYLVNRKSRDILLTRSHVIKDIRSFLNDLHFVEVETPLLAGNGTGANAKPFVTASVHLKDHDDKQTPLYLRVAPELWLKKLVISGFDKVYEIGKSFRNEGLDGTHNPEFTTCEFYQTFTSLEELMQITEVLLQTLLNSLIVNPKLTVTHEPCSKLLELIQSKGNRFARLEFIPTVESLTKVPLPVDLNQHQLQQYFELINLEPPVVKSPAQYLDKLSATFIEPLCEENVPTFIYNQPSIMSALLKSEQVEYAGGRVFEISKRFELFINGREYVNAYEEENNPFKQLENFQLQQESKADFKDEESIVPDYKFVENMELGMSPTGGWGMGIDRLVMLLTGTDRIERVLSFGKLNDVLRQ